MEGKYNPAVPPVPGKDPPGGRDAVNGQSEPVAKKEPLRPITPKPTAGEKPIVIHTPTAESTRSQMPLGKKRSVLGVLVMLIFFIIISLPVGGFLVLDLFSDRGVQRVEDSDLVVEPEKFKSSDNSYLILSLTNPVPSSFSERSLKEIFKNGLDNKIWNQREVDTLLEDNDQTIKLIPQMKEKKIFFDPFFEQIGPIDSTTYDRSRWIDVGYIGGIDAISKSRTGDLQGAIDRAFELLDLGHKMQLGLGDLIQYEIGSELKSMGLSLFREITRFHKLSEDQLKFVLSSIQRRQNNTEGLLKALKDNYTRNRTFLFGAPVSVPQIKESVIDQTIADLPLASLYKDPLMWAAATNSYYFSPTITNNWLFEDRLMHADRISKKCNEDKSFHDPGTLNVSPTNGPGFFFDKNAIGKALASTMVISTETAVELQCERDVEVFASVVVVTVNSFRHDRGHLPNDLSALVPDYINQVLNDPFTNEPFKYNPSRGIVYSTGADLRDDDGSPTSDLVFTVK